MAISIEGITSLGTITQEANHINNNIFQMPIPATSTQTTINMNLLGKTRKITIAGIFSGTIAEITAFINNVETWVNGGIQLTRLYTSSFGHTYYVLCDDFEWTYSDDSPTSISYTMIMVQGGLTR